MSRSERAKHACKSELVALANMVRPTPGNSYQKKLLVTAIIGLWLVFEIGRFAYDLKVPPSYRWVFGFIMYLAGRTHGYQRARLSSGGE